jgi:hypothetical protein
MALSTGKGSSNARTRSDSQSTTNTTTVNNVDNRVFQSDFGAIEAASGIAGNALALSESALRATGDATERAFSFGNDALNSSLDAAGGLATRAFDFSRDAVSGALGFGADAVSSIERVNADSIDFLGALVSNSIDASKTIAREGAQANQSVLADALGGFQKLAVQNSETDSDKMTKVIGLALAAVVAVLVLPKLLGGKAVTV